MEKKSPTGADVIILSPCRVAVPLLIFQESPIGADVTTLSPCRVAVLLSIFHMLPLMNYVMAETKKLLR